MPINTSSPVRGRWTITFDMTSCGAAARTVSTGQTAKGATTDMVFLVKRPSGLSANLAVDASCTTAGQILFGFTNPTAGAIDPTSLSYDVIGF